MSAELGAKPWRRPILIAAALILLAGTLVAIILIAQSATVSITDSTLVDGASDVPVSAPIRLAFSQAMDAASVEERFRIEPSVDGTFSWQGQELVFAPHTALAPDTEYEVSLEAGAASQSGRELREGASWRFRTRAPLLLFLGRTEPGLDSRQLFVVSQDGDGVRQLTSHDYGVWDYAVHPQGQAVVYSVERGDGGTDLWQMARDGSDQRLLLSCPEAACLNPAWSPDGRHLAYERRGMWADAPNLDPKASRLWLLDLEEGKEAALFDYDVPAHAPVWSPHGDWLAYLSPLLPGIEVYNPDTEELLQFSNQWGVAPDWSPDGQHLIVPELMLAGEEIIVRLVRLDLADNSMLDISGGTEEELADYKDVSPAWSPGGGWIAFGRQFLDPLRWTPGRQIWLTRPDASEAYELHTDPQADLFAYAWRPDGGALAYLNTDLSQGPQPVPDVSVWVYDLLQRETLHLADDAVLPRWLP